MTGRRERVRWLVPALAAVVALGAPGVVAADGNVAPSVTATVSNANPVEPQTVVASATFTDPESDVETYTCSIDYGDGGLFATGVVSGTTCTGPAHRYLVTGSYVVMVFVTDSGGAGSVGMTSVRYTNSAPTTPPPGLFGTAPEVGRTVYIAEPFLDSGSAYETYSCTVDYGDGSGSQVGTIVPVWSYNGLPACLGPDHVYQQPGTYTIGAVITDSGNASTSATGSTTITARLSPAVTAPPDKTLTSREAAQYNGFYPYTLGSFTDPGGTTAGPWHWTVDWGDGTAGSGIATSQGSLTSQHHYLPGAHRGHVVVANAAGMSGDAYFNVTVAADLVVGLYDSNQPVTEGVPTTIDLYYYDPFPPAESSPFAIHVAFGDGTAQDISTPGTTLPISLTHTYSADPPQPGAQITAYTATATVTDSQGRTGATTLAVGVLDVAPVVTAGSVTIPEGFSGQVTLASFTDASVGPWTVFIDGGPGYQLQEQVAAPGPITIPYSGSLGSHAFSVSVWDRGGMHATVTAEVVVVGGAPVIAEVHFTPSPDIEGNPVAIVATFTAPGLSGSPPETFSCFVDYGDDPSGPEAGTVSGDQCFGPYHLYLGLGPHTATVSVVGSQGVGTASISLTAQNVPPVVGPVSLPYAFEVGVPVTASATFSDPGSGFVDETYTCTVDYGDGGGAQPGVIDGPTCSGPSHTYTQNGDYAVTVRVTDSNGGVGTSSAAIGLSNIGPSITGLAFNPGPSLLGTPVALVATFTDPGFGVTPETYSCYVAYGDSTGAQPGTIAGNQCIGPDHVYSSGLGPFSVEVFLYDSNGGGDWATTNITLLNIAPVVTGYSVVSFGQSGIEQPYSVIFTDPGSAPGTPPETYTCTIDYGDGAGPQPGVIAGNICTGPDHTYASKGTYTFVATVTDSSGGVGTYTLPIEIYNPWPTIGAVSAPASAMVGTAVTASAAYVSTGLVPADTCSVDYGDGTGPLAGTADGAICTGPSHTYASAGTFRITVTIQSTIGSTDSSSATIQVNSLQVGAVSVSGTLTEGSWVAASAPFTPTGRQTYKCTVNYGDGAGAQVGTISGTTCKGPSHKYGRPGSFTITVTVTGSKGNTGSSTRAVEIANVMPVVTATLPTAAKVGTSVTLSASFTDPGTTETYQVIVDWGDGTRVPIQLGHGRSFTASHTYTTAGGYGVVVEVSDDQMAHVVTAASGIAVYDPARTLSGSGTFASPAGACTFSSKCAAASTATFSVTASYARGATKPTATFTFSAAGISFTATSFEWYTVMNGVGVLHGSGKLNGLSGYRFDVYTVDGAPDKVLVNILDSNGNTVYNNNDYTPLKTGWIVMR